MDRTIDGYPPPQPEPYAQEARRLAHAACESLTVGLAFMALHEAAYLEAAYREAGWAGLRLAWIAADMPIREGQA